MIPENEAGYPDPWMFSENPDNQTISFSLPYRTLMLRHVSDITLDNVKFSVTLPDPRPDFYIEDASDIKATALTVQGKDCCKKIQR